MVKLELKVKYKNETKRSRINSNITLMEPISVIEVEIVHLDERFIYDMSELKVFFNTGSNFCIASRSFSRETYTEIVKPNGFEFGGRDKLKKIAGKNNMGTITYRFKKHNEMEDFLTKLKDAICSWGTKWKGFHGDEKTVLRVNKNKTHWILETTDSEFHPTAAVGYTSSAFNDTKKKVRMVFLDESRRKF